MARMSIDDSVGRDPRISVLAVLLGWSRRETVGCLVSDVWPICYDQRTHLISRRMVDAAAGREGFTDLMVEAELATIDRSGKVRVAGARERIEYLAAKSEAGRQGGLKSAEVRRGRSKQTSSTTGSTPQARRNPPVPDSAPDVSPAPDPVPDVAGVSEFDPFAVASDDMTGPEPQWWGNPPPAAPPSTPRKAKRKASRMPEGWMPEPYTVPPNVDPKLELARFRDWAAAKAATFVDWNAAWRNWLRKAAEFAPRRGPGPGREPETALQVALRLAGES